MSALSKRLDKLSPGNERPEFVMVIAHKGESSEDAIIRHGHNPDDTDKQFYVIQFVSPGEVKHAQP